MMVLLKQKRFSLLKSQKVWQNTRRQHTDTHLMNIREIVNIMTMTGISWSN